MDETVHLLLVLDRDPFADVEFSVSLDARGNLTGDLARQIIDARPLDRGDARFGVQQAPPHVLNAKPERTDDPHAGHNHTAHGWFSFPRVPLTGLFVLLFDVVDRILDRGDL